MEPSEIVGADLLDGAPRPAETEVARDRAATDDEFRQEYDSERSRWAVLAERLK
jgi:hypothetical protein